MRRTSKSASPKISADSQRLVAFSQAIVQSASRLEERAWERNLDALLQKLLKSDHQETINSALDHLFKIETGAYDVLMESVEAMSESVVIEHEGTRYDALLIGVPILAWTRFSIASGPVPADVVMTLGAHLHAHVLAGGTLLAMSPTLFAIDQLPRTHAETFATTQRMALAAIKNLPLRPPVNPPPTAPFLADTRYLLAAVVTPIGGPIFRWQETQNLADRDGALEQWNKQAMPTIARLLPGCGIDLLLPEAYYIACREADKQIRPASIRAAVHYLTNTLNVEAGKLGANIGGFGDEPDGRVDEFRVGFTIADNPDVVYGIVWPLYGPEDEEDTVENGVPSLFAQVPGGVVRKPSIQEILALLAEAGVTDIKRHTERFPMEFCDDCGAPFYPDREGELVHAEMPEDAPQGSGHFH